MNELFKEKALHYLTYKMRSEFEVRQFLEEKYEADFESIEEIIEYLYSYNYLDDEKFARAFVKDKLNFSPVGRYKLTHDLNEKGISSEIIEIVLEDYLDDAQEVEIAKKLLAKKGRLDEDEQKNKRYLYNRGFSMTAINKIFSHTEFWD